MKSPARQRRFRNLSIVAGATLLAATLGFVGYQHANRLPKRFAPVVEGQLYRSGEVHPAHLEALREEYGITRVISLLNPDVPLSQAERDACETLGIRYENIEMRGNGDSTPEARARLMQLLDEADQGPTLVHCAAGTNRTGLAIGLYRIREQGWTYEQVLEEMKQFSFDDLDKHEGMRAALRAAASENLHNESLTELP
ncbi:MAG: tyrosine-protein phosphatase [Phycisphaerae bacterium]